MSPFTPGRVLPARRQQQGLSIVEVMVALTLGLVAVGGSAAIYLANRQSFATVESVARVEEDARFAVDLLSREVRESGNSVCKGALAPINLVSAAPDWVTSDRGLVGNVLVSGGAVAGKIVGPIGVGSQTLNTDSLLVWSGSSGGTPVQIKGYTTASGIATITTSVDHNYQPNDVIVACDGSQLITFQVQTAPSSNTLTYTVGLSPSLNAGGYLNNLSAHIWYVGSGSSPAPAPSSLRRLTIDKAGGLVANDEMIAGVTNLQISYLETDSTGSPNTSDYVTASGITDWSAVTSVRLKLTLSTLDNSGSNGSVASVIRHDVPITVKIKSRLP